MQCNLNWLRRGLGLAGPTAVPFVDGSASIRRRRAWRRIGRAAGQGQPAVGALILILAGTVHGPSRGPNNLAYLGKPTNAVSTSNSFPLDGFHKIGKAWRSGHRLVFLWIGTKVDDNSFEERWPVVKALDQFGTFSGLKPAHQVCGHNPSVSQPVCFIATFNWDHARYMSRYLLFEHKEILDETGRHPYQRLSKTENRYWVRYAERRVSSSEVNNIQATINPPSSYSGKRGLPLEAVGGYLQTQQQLLLQGDFMKQIPDLPPTGPSHTTTPQYTPSGYPFDTIRSDLVTAHDPYSMSHLVEDVNAEANIITALICHADGKKPTSVCGRSVIRSISHGVK